MTVLTEDDQDVEARAPELSDRAVTTLYEVLVLTQVLDESLGRLHSQGQIPFYIPSAGAAAVSAGTALSIDDDDWLYPSFRDAAAYLVRGGSVEQLVAQALGSGADELHGRQLPGHLSLPDGRFVSVSGVAGTRATQAAGTALAMKLRGEPGVALAVCGAGDIDQPSLYGAMDLMHRFRLPAVLVCRSRGSVDVADRAAGFDILGRRVDGGDVLAVYKAVRSARGHAATGKGSRVVDTVLPDGEHDAAARLRPFLERRGIWDPGLEEELRQRLRARVVESIEAAESSGRPCRQRMLDDVLAERPWMLQEQAERIESAEDDEGS